MFFNILYDRIEITQEHEANNSATITKNIVITISIILLFLIFIILYFIRFSKNLTKDFSNVKNSIEELSAYNLAYTDKKDYSNRKDEIGDIFRASSKLKENFINIITAINANAQNTAATAQQLTATAQSTASSSKEVAAAVNNIAQGATSQAQDTQNAAESVDKSNKELSKMLEILKELSSSTQNITTKKTKEQ